MARDIPIIFSAPMVRALLDGRKTQTRRLASSPLAKVQPGDRLWVRESIVRHTSIPQLVGYMADGCVKTEAWEKSCPSIHMPRWASRLTLVVEGVKVERLQDISEEDAQAEGIERMAEPVGKCWFRDPTILDGAYVPTAAMGFEFLWRSLHGEDSWDQDVEVVALTFRVERANIDALSPTPAREREEARHG